ncbi:MAG: alpha/beta-type small acid-soluble spore protein [Firmicutes bacterium]|nr:alpha/beta-type small acid-soluble spore protein [Bacillota bacterium]
MAQFFDKDHLLPHSVLDQFKYEIAEELGITPQIDEGYWGELTSRDCGRVGGRIGGNMVKVMIKRAEEGLAQNKNL